MGIDFRELREDEICCRIGQISKSGNGLTLLLFKNARTDADILDETVGPENWQCEFYECKGTLFCKVGILCERPEINGVRGLQEWVWKDDAGAPSNMEAQKGEASDAFKRACYKWGIGRALYSSPRIWVNSKNCKLVKSGKDKYGNDRYTCYDTFSVAKIKYNEGEIVGLDVGIHDSACVIVAYGKPGFGKEDDGGNQ